MIRTKEDYLYYIHCDEIARWGQSLLDTKIKKYNLRKYNVYLRKLEYSLNNTKIRKLMSIYYRLK